MSDGPKPLDEFPDDLVESTMVDYEMGPPSPAPCLCDVDEDTAVEMMLTWFSENFEDPVARTPCDEGAYVWIWGGPYNAREELAKAFGKSASDWAIGFAAELLEEDGLEWAPSGQRMQPIPATSG